MRLNAAEKRPGEVFLDWPQPAADPGAVGKRRSDQAAARLFGALRAADRLAQARGAAAIAVAPVPDTGLGRAINDRLQRAAAPRS